MSAVPPETPVLTLHVRAGRWLHLLLLVCGAFFVAAIVLSVIGWVETGTPTWTLAIAPLQVLLAAMLSAQRLRKVVISEAGVRWHGVGWTRERPWSDIRAVSRRRVGTNGRAIVVLLTAEARPPSLWTYPLRLGLRRRVPQAVAIFVPLSNEGSRRPAWDVSDDEIVRVVERYAGDRWAGVIS